MNTPDEIVVDADEMRAWLLSYKEETGLSWTKLGDRSGIPSGSLSPWATGNYPPRKDGKDEIANKVYRFRQTVVSQAEQRETMVEGPSYFETPTAKAIIGLLRLAHAGDITVGAMGPGVGKTIAAKRYKDSVSNCWIITVEPVTGGLTAMVNDTLRVVDGVGKQAWTRMQSRQVAAAVRGRNGLLVYDEANNLSLEALEQIRTWHDDTGVGVCLLGNEELMQRLRGVAGGRRDALARLNSRIGYSALQDMPRTGDVEAFCGAWGIADAAMRGLLQKIAMTPGAGGLREITKIVKAANMLALEDGQPLSFANLRDAQSTRHTQNIKVPA